VKPDYNPTSPSPWVYVAVAVAILAAFGVLAFLVGRANGQDRKDWAIQEVNAKAATPEALGYKLFRDPILSSTGKVSCAGCHDPGHAYASHAALPLDLEGRPLARKAPSLLNRHAGRSFFWDGRAKSLEAQALEVIGNPQEMGGPVADAVARLAADAKYRRYFEEAYGEGPTAKNLAACLAAYERTLKSRRVALDDHLEGRNELVLSAAEARGLTLFTGRAQCYRCHSGPYLTDEGLHDTGLGRFKTPGLRSTRLTAPYMHDGSLPTLRAVVNFYNRGGVRTPTLDPLVRPLGLSPAEVDDLVAFLRSL
jgi:cytochrome c peroxidase